MKLANGDFSEVLQIIKNTHNKMVQAVNTELVTMY